MALRALGLANDPCAGALLLQAATDVAAPPDLEDPRLLRGEGQYVDDLTLDNVADVAFVRSAHAHARISAIHTEAAKAAPGVLAVWTGADVRDVPRLPSRARGVEGMVVGQVPLLRRERIARRERRRGCGDRERRGGGQRHETGHQPAAT